MLRFPYIIATNYQLFITNLKTSAKIRTSCQDCANTWMVLAPALPHPWTHWLLALTFTALKLLRCFCFHHMVLFNSRVLLEQSSVPEFLLYVTASRTFLKQSGVMVTAVLLCVCQKHSRKHPGSAVSCATMCPSVCGWNSCVTASCAEKRGKTSNMGCAVWLAQLLSHHNHHQACAKRKGNGSMRLPHKDNTGTEKRGISGSSPGGKLTKPSRQPIAPPAAVTFWLLSGRRADGAEVCAGKACMFARKVPNVLFP